VLTAVKRSQSSIDLTVVLFAETVIVLPRQTAWSVGNIVRCINALMKDQYASGVIRHRSLRVSIAAKTSRSKVGCQRPREFVILVIRKAIDHWSIVASVENYNR